LQHPLTPQLIGAFQVSDGESDPNENLPSAIGEVLNADNDEGLNANAGVTTELNMNISRAPVFAENLPEGEVEVESSTYTESEDDTPEPSNDTQAAPGGPAWRAPTSFNDNALTRHPFPRVNPEPNTVEASNQLDIESAQRLKTALNPRILDDYIEATLRSPLPKAQAQSNERGLVYILRDPLRPGFVKIGMTKNTITNRREGLEASCGRSLEVVYLDDEDGEAQLPHENYKRVESIVHKELTHYRRHPLCLGPRCRRKHREWFEISEEVAKQTVRRWVIHMKRNPYDELGNLKPFWHSRLDARPRPKSSEMLDHHNVRHKRWDLVLSASKANFFWHFVYRELFEKRTDDRRLRESLYIRIVRMRWQLTCAALSLCIFLLTFPCKGGTTILVLAGLCLVYSVLTD
jgi:hypothetical protein